MQLYSEEPLVIPSSDFTGFITVTTAGTEVQGPVVTNPRGFYIQGHPANTGNVLIMAHGQQSSDVGFSLDANVSILVRVADLSALDFDATVNGEILCWMKA